MEIYRAPLLLALAACLSAAEKPIPLWPQGAPGPAFNPGSEHDATTAQDNPIAGQPLIRLANVSEPSVTYYPAPQERNSGAAVVVFPGGGYRILALDLEGSEVCAWLNSIGVNAVLLKYRVPSAPGTLRYAAPLQDAQRAMGIVRSHAAAWSLDPHRLGVLGFSAGGHLAALLSNSFEKRSYPPLDKSDDENCRPDFSVLIYPAYLTPDADLTTLAPEFHVTAQTPPTFLVQTEDDPVHVENSLIYYHALKNAKVPAELHVFATGGHGYGLRATAEPVTEWPKLAAAWLRARGILR